MTSNPNWAEIPPLMQVEETFVLTFERDAELFSIRTLTVLSGFVFDDEDGLPLAFPGER